MANAVHTINLSKIDPAAVMRTAWARYREWHSFKERLYGPRKFDRIEFAQKLAAAWATAKQAQMSLIERRRNMLVAQIEALPFKAAQIDITPKRRQLEAALRQLAA